MQNREPRGESGGDIYARRDFRNRGELDSMRYADPVIGEEGGSLFQQSILDAAQRRFEYPTMTNLTPVWPRTCYHRRRLDPLRNQQSVGHP